MHEDAANHLNIFIDGLTNSIRRIADGKSCDTEMSLASRGDINLATKKNNWHFPRVTEFKREDRTVYKLTLKDEPGILQELISLSKMADHVYVHLAESAPLNYGDAKKHEGVGGNLFAFACKLSWDSGNEGIIAFQSKTKLIGHYQQVLGAVRIGGHNMIVYPEQALILIRQYF